ncbi:MAG: hypothetical protein AB7U85_07240 [Alphaproteobacteria bacterium]
MDWSQNNNKNTDVGQKSARSKKREENVENATLKDLGENFHANSSTLKREVLDMIMKKRGLDHNSVHDKKVTESNTQSRTNDLIEEHILDNIRNNRVEKGGAEEAKNPYASTQKNASERSNEDRIHRRENRANESRKILRKHKIKMPKGLKNKALDNARNNPNAKAKDFEKAAKKRASSGLFSFSIKDNKYYKEFSKYLGKKVAKKEEKEEKKKSQVQVQKIEKSRHGKMDKNERRKLSMILEKSGRHNTKAVKKVTKRELSAEQVRMAKEKAADRSK